VDKYLLESLKNELSIKAKNGIDFILAASIIWFVIAFIWSLDTNSYEKSVLTFMVGGLMIPLAFLLSKILRTKWKIQHNPLQSLGLWLNFAQLFYFPFLIFVLIKTPDHFVMTYAIITGAHFFPYGWFYNAKAYSIVAGVISLGALTLGFALSAENMFWIPIFTGVTLVVLAISIFINYKHKKKHITS
jgi:hypothetical protein